MYSVISAGGSFIHILELPSRFSSLVFHLEFFRATVRAKYSSTLVSLDFAIYERCEVQINNRYGRELSAIC